MSWFDSGPSTYLTQRIEAAVQDEASAEDLALHLEICDIINETEDGARESMKYLRKKLLSTKSSHGCVYKCLIVMETAAKNCHRRFHEQLASKDSVAAYRKLLLNKKQNMSFNNREKLLGLIQSWSDAFSSDPALVNLPRFYRELLSMNIEFPAQNLDEMAPIHTPVASVTPEHRQIENAVLDAERQQAQVVNDAAPEHFREGTATPTESTRPQEPANVGHNRQRPPQMMEQIIPLHPGQRIAPDQRLSNKLRLDIQIVHNTVTMLGDMLTALDDEEDPRSNDVITELHVSISQMQARIPDLIEHIDDENLVMEALSANDVVAAVLERYNNFIRKFETANSPAPQQTQATSPQPTIPTPATTFTSQPSSMPSRPPPSSSSSQPASNATGRQLADFDDLLGESVADAQEEDDFNMFAQHRANTYQSSTYDDNINSGHHHDSISSAIHKRPAPPQQDQTVPADPMTLASMQEEPDDMMGPPSQPQQTSSSDLPDLWAQPSQPQAPSKPLSPPPKDDQDFYGL